MASPRAREIDEPALDIGLNELDLDAIAHVERLESANELPFRRGARDAHPNALARHSRDDRPEPLSDARGEQQGGGGLAHAPPRR